MSDKSQAEQLQEIGKCAMASIREMVGALECDYDRLEELRDERESLADDLSSAEECLQDIDEDDTEEYAEAEADVATARRALEEWDADNAEELKDLEDAAGECSDQDEARQRIEEDALSVEVRSDWYTPGADEDARKPGEFCILLSTGGPATRIIGDLDDSGTPTRARLEVQDWFAPWTEYLGDSEDYAALLTYSQVFYFGE